MEQCCLCDGDIAAGTPVTEFPCHHKSHVPCVFRSAVNNGFGIQCHTCNTLIVPIEVFNEILGDRGHDDTVDTEQVKNIQEVLMKRNKDFKKDAKVFKGSVRELRSARCALQTKMKVMRTQFKQDVHAFVHAVTEIRKKYLEDAQTCDEYKRVKAAQKRSSYYLTRLSRKWNIYPRNFYKGLVKRNDFWSFSSHRNRYAIRGALRVQWLW